MITHHFGKTPALVGKYSASACFSLSNYAAIYPLLPAPGKSVYRWIYERLMSSRGSYELWNEPALMCRRHLFAARAENYTGSVPPPA